MTSVTTSVSPGLNLVSLVENKALFLSWVDHTTLVWAKERHLVGKEISKSGNSKLQARQFSKLTGHVLKAFWVPGTV